MHERNLCPFGNDKYSFVNDLTCWQLSNQVMLEPNQDVVSFKRLWWQWIYHNSFYDCSNQVHGNDEKVFEVSDKLTYYLLPIAY